jgi:hypothetical protein
MQDPGPAVGRPRISLRNPGYEWDTSVSIAFQKNDERRFHQPLRFGRSSSIS